MADDVEHALTLRGWGTRFDDPTTERAFHQWNFDRSCVAHRLTLRLGTAFVAATHAAMFVLLAFSSALFWSVPMIAVYAAIIGQFVTFAQRDARAFRVAGAVALAVESAVGSAGLVELGDLDHGALVLVGAVSISFWLAATAADRLAIGPCAVFLVSALTARVQAWSAGQLAGGGLAVEGVFLIFCLLAVPLIVASAERSGRMAYRQERIIESQRATIARQQERLEKELSHQVAERSRELGAVLARSDVTLDVRALKTGERFAERYKIVSTLGAGGMGAVYEVERVTDGEKLALKVVVGELSGASAARFAREAEIGARLRHPNLVSIVDVGVAAGVPFLAMELVRGGSLESQRARFGDVAWARPILRQIAEGLAALHEAGVVHRDLKPANVLLTATGAKISDFGISRFGALDDALVDGGADTLAVAPRKSAELTGTGVVMGTPLYMAPEAARSARGLDAAADVFALGILAYEMLTGHAPFAVPAFVLAMSAQPIPVPPPIDDAQLTPALCALVRTSLAGDPAARPRVRELLASL